MYLIYIMDIWLIMIYLYVAILEALSNFDMACKVRIAGYITFDGWATSNMA